MALLCQYHYTMTYICIAVYSFCPSFIILVQPTVCVTVCIYLVVSSCHCYCSYMPSVLFVLACLYIICSYNIIYPIPLLYCEHLLLCWPSLWDPVPIVHYITHLLTFLFTFVLCTFTYPIEPTLYLLPTHITFCYHTCVFYTVCVLQPHCVVPPSTTCLLFLDSGSC